MVLGVAMEDIDGVGGGGREGKRMKGYNSCFIKAKMFYVSI